VSFGGPLILDKVNLTIEPGERVALVGRNGEGKSTLLKALCGELTLDSGTVRLGEGVRIARLMQEVPRGTKGTVFEVASEGLGHVGKLVAHYHHLTIALEEAIRDGKDSERLLEKLGEAGAALEADDGWSANSRVDAVLERMGLDPDAVVADLSSGMTRRVLLAQALVGQPSLLLLDEPTNHLDVEAITWLERFLSGYGGSLLLITHDRVFLEKLSTRIVELDRGTLTSWPGRFSKYLEGKAALLAAEETSNALFDKRLAQEETWIRKGIKARRTRNEGRVRALKKMRSERSDRRVRQGTVNMALLSGERSGKLVVEAEGADFAYGDGRTVIRGLTTTIMRGDKVGIIGPNGAGKTTLIKLLLGEHGVTNGKLRVGTGLQVAYFDQLRTTLKDTDTVRHAVSDGLEEIMIGDRKRHVMSYLRDFLFTPDRAKMRVGKLSGGERNRLLLARLFTRPANLLVMDEPTNDLDMETLELLEELLLDYSGTLLLVSHDRAFLNNVVGSVLAFEGDGKVTECVGGYDDWQRQRMQAASGGSKVVEAIKSTPAKVEKPPKTTAPKASKGKLSYHEKKELVELPARIEALEIEQAELTEAMNDPALYQDAKRAKQAGDRLAEVGTELEVAYARWEKLDR